MVRTTIWEGSLRTSFKPLDGISITSSCSKESINFPSPPPTSSCSAYVNTQTSPKNSQPSDNFVYHAHPSPATTPSPPIQQTQIRRIKLKLGNSQPLAPKVEATETWVGRLKKGICKGDFVVREDLGSVIKLADLDPGILSRSVEEDLRSGFKIRATNPTEPSGLLYFHAALIPEPGAASLSLDAHGRTIHGLLIDFVPFKSSHDESSLSLLIYGIKSPRLASTPESDQKRPKKASLSIFAVQFPTSDTPSSPASMAPIESIISSSAPSTPCVPTCSNGQLSGPSSAGSHRLRPRGTFSPRHPRLSNITQTPSTLPSSREPSPIPIITPAQVPKSLKNAVEPSNADQETSEHVNKITVPSSTFTFTASALTKNKQTHRPVDRSTTIKRIILKRSSLYSSKSGTELVQTQMGKEQKDRSESSDQGGSSSSLDEKEEEDFEESESETDDKKEGESETEREEEEEGEKRAKEKIPTSLTVQTAHSVKPSLSPPTHPSNDLPPPPLSVDTSQLAVRPDSSRHILPLRRPSSITTNNRSAHPIIRSKVENQPKTQLKTRPARPPPLPDVGFSHPFSSDGENDEGPIKPIKSELFKDKVSRGEVLIEQDPKGVTMSARNTERIVMMKRKRRMHEKPVRMRSKRFRRGREENDNIEGKSLTSCEAAPKRSPDSKEALQAGYTTLNKLLLRRSVDEALQTVNFPRTHPEFHTIWAWIVRGCAFSLRETFSTQELEEADLAEAIQTHIQSYLPSSFRYSRSSSVPDSNETASPYSNSSVNSDRENEGRNESETEDEKWMQGGDLMAFAEIWVAAGQLQEQETRRDISALAPNGTEEKNGTSSDLGGDGHLSSSSAPSPSSYCPDSRSTSSSESDDVVTPSSFSSSSDSGSTPEASTLQRPCPISGITGAQSTIPIHSMPHRDHVLSQIRLPASTPSPGPALGSNPRPDMNTMVRSKSGDPKNDHVSEFVGYASQQKVIDVIDDDETEDETWF